MKYRNGYSSHWERQFTCPRSLSYWRKWALHEERYILHVLYWLVNSKLSVESAIFPSRVEVLTLPYMVWRVWLTEILETFQRVFRFEKSRIKENGGNWILYFSKYSLLKWNQAILPKLLISVSDIAWNSSDCFESFSSPNNWGSNNDSSEDFSNFWVDRNWERNIR